MDKLEELSKKYVREQESLVFKRVDKQFQVLLFFEWIFGIVSALLISPRTWSGDVSQVHLHLWTAILLGGVIIAFPIFLVFVKKGTKLSRYVIAISQMLFGSLLIHLMGGRIEAHFYIFGSLAFLAAYRDWGVLIPATLVVAVDHFIRGIYWPQSIYGVITASEWRWLEHAAWVIFEDIFLIITIVESKKDMVKLAINQAEIKIHNQQIEQIVIQKTDEIKLEQAKLVNASKLASLSEMAGGIAHEINNPLAIISTSMKLLMKAKSKNLLNDKMLTDIVDDVELTIQRITKIITGKRTVSRDTTETNIEPVKLKEIFDDVLSLCKEKFKNLGVKVEVKLDSPEFQNKILGDRVQLSQVFINLMGNAFDAIKDIQNKWIKIEISADDKFQVIKIIDSGKVIPKEIQEKMFNPFYTSKEIGKGTGLGLSISKTIVTKFGGVLELDNSSSNTCFIVKLLNTNESFKNQKI